MEEGTVRWAAGGRAIRERYSVRPARQSRTAGQTVQGVRADSP